MMCREAGGEDALRGWDVGSPLLLMPRKKKMTEPWRKDAAIWSRHAAEIAAFLVYAHYMRPWDAQADV